MSPDFTMQQISAVSEQIAIIILSFAVMFFIFAFPLILLSYIFSSIGYTRMAKRLEIKNRFFAWIPFLRNWTLGAICDELESPGQKRKRNKIILLCAGLAKLFGWAMGLLVFATGVIYTFAFLGMDMGVWDQLFDMGVPVDPTTAIPMLIIDSVMAVFYAIYFIFPYKALRIIAVHKIFEALRPRLSYLHTTLGILIPLYRAVCIMKFSKSVAPEEPPALPEAAANGWYEE